MPLLQPQTLLIPVYSNLTVDWGISFHLTKKNGFVILNSLLVVARE